MVNSALLTLPAQFMPARRRSPRGTGGSRYARSSGMSVRLKTLSRDWPPSGGSWQSPGQTWKLTRAALSAELALALLLLELRQHPERVPAVMAGL